MKFKITPAAARLHRVALLNQLLVFPRDTIARELGDYFNNSAFIFTSE
jgi:hypothetical protein